MFGLRTVMRCVQPAVIGAPPQLLSSLSLTVNVRSMKEAVQLFVSFTTSVTHTRRLPQLSLTIPPKLSPACG